LLLRRGERSEHRAAQEMRGAHRAKRAARLAARRPEDRERSKPRTQDGRALPRYRRRWKVERTLAWLGSFRRLPIALKIQLNPFASRQIQRILFFWICPIFACFTRSTVTIS
jgi:transposase